MSKLKEKELLKHLAHMFKCYEYNFINVDWKPPEEGVQAYKQIKEMIQKPGVTEEWIEEKAKELITMVANLYPHEGNPCVIPKSKAKDFIRSLVEEIKKWNIRLSLQIHRGNIKTKEQVVP